MKIKFLAPFMAFSITAFSQIIASSQPSWWENKLAGSYFQHASIVGQGSHANETLNFLQSHFSGNAEWTENTMESDEFKFSYFLRNSVAGSPIEIVALPFVCKKTSYAYDLTFDAEMIDSLSGKSFRALTIQFMENLQVLHAGNLKVHFMASQGPSEKKYTKLGQTIFAILGDDNNIGHYQYACAALSAAEMNVTVYDPVFVAYEKYFLANAEDKNIEMYGDISFKGHKAFSTVKYRNDQVNNMHDCARFSMVYLLSAVSGIDPGTLNNLDVYRGFKQWIESPSGYLSFQKKNIGPRTLTPDPQHYAQQVENFYSTIVQDMAGAPKLQPSKMARVTGLWRKAVDVMLYAPRVTEAAAVAGVSYALYLGSIWLRNTV